MVKITGNEYLKKHGYLPSGYSSSSMIDDVAPNAKYQPTGGTRTVDAGTYVNNVNNPNSFQQQIQELLKQSQTSQQALLDAYSKPYTGPDYSEFLKPIAGPDYSGLQGLIAQSAGLKTQANKFQNTLEDLPQTLQQLYRDTGIEQNQLDRTTAIQSEPIVKSLERLIRAAGVIDQQVGQGRELARDQYNVNLQNRQFGLQGLQLQDQSQRSAYEQKLKGLELGAQFPTQQIGLLSELEKLLNPKKDYQYFTNEATGDVSVYDPKTGQVVQTLPGVAAPRPYASSGGSGFNLGSLLGLGADAGIPAAELQKLSKLTQGDRDFLGTTATTLAQLQQAAAMLQNKNITGGLASPINFFNNLAGKDTDTGKFNSLAQQIAANYQKLISGAAVSEGEVKRLRQFLPNINKQESINIRDIGNLSNRFLSELQARLRTAGINISPEQYIQFATGGSVGGGASSGVDYGSQYGF